MNFGPFEAFLRDRLRKDPALICPVMVLWREYLSYCELWGFVPGSASDFVTALGLEEEVSLRTGGSGRLRRVAVGLGFRAQALDRRRVA